MKKDGANALPVGIRSTGSLWIMGIISAVNIWQHLSIQRITMPSAAHVIRFESLKIWKQRMR